MDQAENLRLLVKKHKEQEIELSLSPKLIKGKTKIYAVTSGKGGVGKTNLTLNMAILLAKESNKKVLVLDADLGTANIDIMMGIIPKYNISHLFFDNKSLEEIIIDGPYNVKILPGVSGLADFTSLTEAQKEDFFIKIDNYQSSNKLDYIFIDTGAGLGSNVINFLLAADEIIVLVTQEPTSLSDAYAVIKVLNKYDSTIKVNVVVNMVRNEDEAKKVFNTIHAVSEKFLNKNLTYMGFLRYDKIMPMAVKQQKPLVLSFPNSEMSMEILTLSNRITSNVVDNKSSIKSFFQLAGKYFGWNND